MKAHELQKYLEGAGYIKAMPHYIVEIDGDIMYNRVPTQYKHKDLWSSRISIYTEKGGSHAVKFEYSNKGDNIFPLYGLNLNILIVMLDKFVVSENYIKSLRREENLNSILD